MLLTQEEIEALLIERHGRKIQETLKNAHVAIAGLGGLGSHVAVMLTRAGVGSLHLVDFDVVDKSNLNRQMYGISHLGRPKTEALTDILREINPYIQIQTEQMKVTEENAATLFQGDAILCEAFDQPDQKAMLINTILTERSDMVIVSASGMAGYGSANEIHTDRKMKRLYLCGDEKSEISEENALMAPRVMICAGHQANMILRLLLGMEEP